MKLTPAHLNITRPTTKVDADETERIEEAIKVTHAKMYDKAMELDTHHSVEYIEAAELAALAALELPTWQHAQALKESLKQGGALGTATQSQATFALNGAAAQGQPDPAGAASSHEIQARDQYLKAVAAIAEQLLDGPGPIIDQFQTKWDKIKDRLLNPDENHYVAMATHEATKEELRQLKESITRAGGSEVEINGFKYVKLTAASADRETIDLSGTKYVKVSKFDEVVGKWQSWGDDVAKAIKKATDAGKKYKKSKVPGSGYVFSTENATELGDAHQALTNLRNQLPGVDNE